MVRSLTLVLSLTALAACTQAPAQVSVMGGNNYSRSEGGYQTSSTYYNGQSATANNTNQSAPIVYGSPDMQNNASVSQTTQQVAPSASISVSDLSTPSPAAKPTAPTPSAPVSTLQAPTPASQPQTLTVSENKINPWTQKPREETAVATPADNGTKPFIWPVGSSHVTSSFGPKSTGKANDGITISANEGEPVWAAADGEVVYSDNSLKGYGNMVLVKHKGGKTTTYANLSRRAVEKYDRVKQGDIIGYVGSTGSAKTSQLYFAVRQGTDAVDPETLTKKP